MVVNNDCRFISVKFVCDFSYNLLFSFYYFVYVIIFFVDYIEDVLKVY